jgi:hypothetical protein
MTVHHWFLHRQQLSFVGRRDNDEVTDRERKMRRATRPQQMST